MGVANMGGSITQQIEGWACERCGRRMGGWRGGGCERDGADGGVGRCERDADSEPADHKVPLSARCVGHVLSPDW